MRFVPVLLVVFFFSSLMANAISFKCPSGKTVSSDHPMALFIQRWEFYQDEILESQQTDERYAFYKNIEKVMLLGEEGYYLKFGGPAAAYYQEKFIPQLEREKNKNFASVLNKIGQQLISGVYHDAQQGIDGIRSFLCHEQWPEIKKISSAPSLRSFLERRHIKDHKRSYREGGYGTLKLQERIRLALTPPFFSLFSLMRRYPYETSQLFLIAFDDLLLRGWNAVFQHIPFYKK